MDSIEALFKHIPVFEGMKPEHLAEIAGCASNVRFNEG